MYLVKETLNLTKKGDLLYYEGPLLSHFVDDKDNNYLVKWVDNDDTTHTWLIIRTYQLLAHFKKEISFLDLIKNADKLWLIKLDDDLNLCYEETIKFKQINKDYLPSASAFYDENHYDKYCKDLQFNLQCEKDKSMSKIVHVFCIIFIIGFILYILYNFLLIIYLLWLN
jgi:hypothetical protein